MKISVLTPSFNSGKYIERAIKSVLNQGYGNIEHIIVDNLSTDDTREIVAKYSHIKFISESDFGQSDAMNKAFKASSGDLISYLNADDYFEPGVFEFVNDYFKKNETVDFLVGNLYNKYWNDPLLVHLSIPESEFNKIIFPFKYEFPLNPVSYFYKRKVQENIGEFPINEHYAMDYWFLIRAFKNFKINKSELVFGTFYRTGINKTSLNKSNPTIGIARKFMFEQSSYYGVKFQVFYSIHQFLQLKKAPKKAMKFLFYHMFLKRKYTYEEFQLMGLKKIIRNE